MKIKRWNKSPLAKRAKRGFRGYPVATIAFYGPTAERASKVAVGILMYEGAEPDITKWQSDESDLLHDHETGLEILALLREHQVMSVVMTDRIIGCPHEEEIDYPLGEECPQCPYWRGKDRWTGLMVN